MIRLLALLMLIASSSVAAEPFRVVGYLPDYRGDQFNPEAAAMLTDLIVFSAQPTADGGIDMSRLKRMPWEKLRATAEKQKLRLLLAVGGWKRSEAFPAIVASEEKRNAFAEAAVKICQTEKLNGIDLDWEHPKNKAEEEGYGKLLVAIKKAFKPHSLIVSITMAGWQKMTPEGYEAADIIQVMAYDHDGRHSTFENATAEVKKVIDAGVAPSKIVFGLPFYGRGIKERNKTPTYKEIVAKYQPKPEIDEVDGIYFNGPDTIRRKVSHAREKGLAGVMFWELGQDAGGDASLLRVIYQEANRKP
jgi:chitinase